VSLVIEAGGGDVRVPEPLLDAGDIRVVIKGVRGSRRAKGVGANPGAVDPRGCGIPLQHMPVNSGRGERLVRVAAAVFHRPEQGGGSFVAVSGGLEVLADAPLGGHVDGEVSELATLTANLQMHHAAAEGKILNAELHELLAAEPVV